MIIESENLRDSIGAEGGGGTRLVRHRPDLVEVLGDRSVVGQVEYQQPGWATDIKISGRAILKESVFGGGEEMAAVRADGESFETEVVTDATGTAGIRQEVLRQALGPFERSVERESPDQGIDATVGARPRRR